MSQHHDSHGGGGGGGMEWLATHMGGIIIPFGEWFERILDKLMFFVVNGFFRKAATVYLFIFTPLLVAEFLFQFVTH